MNFVFRKLNVKMYVIEFSMRIKYSFREPEMHFIILKSVSSLWDFSSQLIHSNYTIQIPFFNAMNVIEPFIFNL